MTAVQSAPPTTIINNTVTATTVVTTTTTTTTLTATATSSSSSTSSNGLGGAGNSGNNNGISSILQYVNESNLSKIESFLNDSAYREAIENSSSYNSRLCRERRLRMPFLDSQTGVAQNHSNLFMSARERLPGLQHGQIYTYPSKRWRKKRRQYLMNYFHPKRIIRGDIEDGVDCGIETSLPGVNDDSKDSLALKDEHSKDAWYLDEQDMLDIEPYDEPDPDSDFDYEESYSSKRKRRKPRGSGHHPARNHPPATDSPSGKRTKGGGRGRKKVNYDASDTDKPFVCDLCSARYKTRPGLVYHYSHSHSTSSGDPAKELSPSPADVESRSVADAVATDQPGGTRRGRQSTASSSPSATSTSSIPGSAGGCGTPAIIPSDGTSSGSSSPFAGDAPTSVIATNDCNGDGAAVALATGRSNPRVPSLGMLLPCEGAPANGADPQEPQPAPGRPAIGAAAAAAQQLHQQPPESSCAAPASPTVSASNTASTTASAASCNTAAAISATSCGPAGGSSTGSTNGSATNNKDHLGLDGRPPMSPGGTTPLHHLQPNNNSSSSSDSLKAGVGVDGRVSPVQHHQGNHHHAGGMDGKKNKPAQPSPYCDFCLGDARENKKTGGSEELVSCSDCGRSGKHQRQAQPEERVKRKYTRRVTAAGTVTTATATTTTAHSNNNHNNNNHHHHHN
ncbi:mucin-19 [Copidosoma floridanum]|uniref:mucin-19 n=1 Tax=Copidosoma floridanum TaxID=29053 RepID=UPI000C6F489F|nr:mucin-19 [Copidosoma floridanum]